MGNIQTEVTNLPNCDICLQKDGIKTPAKYDGKINQKPYCWAFMCEIHFRAYGIGLGVGRGQKLVVRRTK